MAVNPMAFSSKDVVLDVVRTERSRFFYVVNNPANWKVDSRCEGWQVRDLVGRGLPSRGFGRPKRVLTRRS